MNYWQITEEQSTSLPIVSEYAGEVSYLFTVKILGNTITIFSGVTEIYNNLFSITIPSAYEYKLLLDYGDRLYSVELDIDGKIHSIPVHVVSKLAQTVEKVKLTEGYSEEECDGCGKIPELEIPGIPSFTKPDFWNSIVKNVNFLGEPNQGYLIDTSSTPITLTLPKGIFGYRIGYMDLVGTANTQNITLVSEDKIMGVSAPLVIKSPHETGILIYTGSEYGWKYESVTPSV